MTSTQSIYEEVIMAEETIDDMLVRVGRDMQRRSKALYVKADNMDHDPRNQAKVREKAARWGGYASYCDGKGTFPINGADPELSLIYKAERAQALAAKAYIVVDPRTTADGLDALSDRELAALGLAMDEDES
jgi:hypothetical protein